MALIQTNSLRMTAPPRIAGGDDPLDDETHLRMNRLRWKIVLAGIEGGQVAHKLRTEHNLPFIVRGRFGGCYQTCSVPSIERLEALVLKELLPSHQRYQLEHRL